MANPRKFKEKIALVKQKEVEGTAEFEKIMKEVLDVKAKKEDAGSSNARVQPGTAVPYRESRGRSVGGGPMRRPSERKVDTSPYSGSANVYLSPPSESTWRRASSDSAIHQSLSLVQDKNITTRNFEAANQKRYTQPSALNHRMIEPNRNLSPFELSQGPSNLLSSSYLSTAEQLSTSMANTGSLPDLTSVHFPGTHKTIYKEPETSSSPYSSSPVTSPATLSPISMSNRNTYSRAHSPSDNNTYSPTNFGIRNHQESEFASYQAAQIGQTSHLSFTNLPGLVHQNKGSSISSYNILHGSHGHLTSIGMTASSNLSEYRNPQSRPSPGSSPGILATMQGSETNPNSPCSPMPDHKSSHSHDNFQTHRYDGFNINQSFQNHFEHISLVDSNNSDQINNIPQPADIFSSIQYDGNPFVHFEPNSATTYGANISQPYNDSMSNADKLNNMGVSRNENYSNPKSDTSCDICPINMPTKIPEIVFSDFSTGNQDFPKDSCIFTEIFGSLDLELGQMDVAGYQMLADPNSPMITDPMIEDGFRRDLN